MIMEDKKFKQIILLCIVVITFSIFYYFVIRPFQKDTPLRDCLKKAELELESYKNPSSLDLYGNTLKDVYDISVSSCYRKFK